MLPPLTQKQLLTLGAPADDALLIVTALTQCDQSDELSFWQQLTRDLLKPSLPFAVHQQVHQQVFSNWDRSKSPVPVWSPTEDQIRRSNLGQIMETQGFDDYRRFQQWSADHPADFVQMMCDRLGVVFQKNCETYLDLAKGRESPTWFPHAQLNIAESCFLAEQSSLAIKMQQTTSSGEPSDVIRELTYGELQHLVGQVVNSLHAQGVKKGDRIGLAIPMTIESVAIYLGIIAAGCSAVTVAESFSSDEMAVRFDLTRPVCIFTQDIICRQNKNLPLYQKVCEASQATCIVIPALQQLSTPLRDHDLAWHSFLVEESDFEFESAAPDDEMTVLFSSGTTGQPKAIPWDHTIPLKAANDAHLHQDVHPGDVIAWPTSLGWMMGPWLVFASLLNQGCIALNSGAPSTRAFGKFVRDAGVTMLGLVPSMVSAWRSSDCMSGLDWQKIRNFSSTGECSNAEDMHYLMILAGYKPVIEYCGGTEIGGGYIASTVIQPNVPGTFSSPTMGSAWYLLDEDQQEAPTGEVFFKPPCLGFSTRLLQRDHHAVYYKNNPTLKINGEQVLLRRHGDQLETLPGGYFRARGRTDDAMNLGGIKVSSIQIEEVLQEHCDEIIEAAAIAISPEGGGPSQLLIYTVLQSSSDHTAVELKPLLQSIISQQLNPLFRIREVIPIDSLPRTASNKIMRRQLRAQHAKSDQ